jgi:Asp-tRNA(Asn)/Glu-tRNA(Gln) amidotransferase A subunit family amidase
MARTVADIAIVLDATVGYDPADPITATSNGKIPPTYMTSLKRDALNGARIGVLNELFGAAPEDQEVGARSSRRRGWHARRDGGRRDRPDLTGQLAASNLLARAQVLPR